MCQTRASEPLIKHYSKYNTHSVIGIRVECANFGTQDFKRLKILIFNTPYY